LSSQGGLPSKRDDALDHLNLHPGRQREAVEERLGLLAIRAVALADTNDPVILDHLVDRLLDGGHGGGAGRLAGGEDGTRGGQWCAGRRLWGRLRDGRLARELAERASWTI
jgi:hypothetical protein